MHISFFKPALLTAALAFSFAAAHAQNIAIVNGKAVPKSRVQALAAQLERSGRAVTPEMEQQLREEVIIREVFLQEAQNKGMDSTDDYKTQMELARQSILIRELFADFQKNNPVTDAEVKAEYDKFASMNGGKEYKSRHILVEKEDQAKAIIASLKKGGKFEDSEVTSAPVKSQFGFHIIRLDDIRDAQLPKIEEVKPQILQQLQSNKLAEFQQSLREKAKIE